MKANELRIGNYVQWNKTAISQMELSDFSNWYNDVNSHEYSDYIQPIPLTEEWLLKFGFIYEKEDECYKDYLIHRFFINTYDNNNNFYLEGYDIAIGKIKYVHQLQNLYFALCGSELKIENK